MKPVLAGLFLSGWYVHANCQQCTVISVLDAPRPSPRIVSKCYMLWPIMEHKLGSCRQVLGSYEVSVVGGYCDVRGLGGRGCGGTLGGSLS